MEDIKWKLQIERDLATMKEHGRWIASKLEEMDKKQDILLESHTSFKSKIAAQTATVGTIVTLIVYFIVSYFRSQ